LTDLQTLPPNTIELGMGAHGEPGLQQISPVPSPEDLTRMINLLTDTTDSDRAYIPFSQIAVTMPESFFFSTLWVLPPMKSLHDLLNWVSPSLRVRL
jgi:hypothetical protein